jgi:hypothetical protein
LVHCLMENRWMDKIHCATDQWRGAGAALYKWRINCVTAWCILGVGHFPLFKGTRWQKLPYMHYLFFSGEGCMGGFRE